MKNFKTWLLEEATKEELTNTILATLPQSVSQANDIEQKMQIRIQDLNPSWFHDILQLGEVKQFVTNPAKMDILKNMARHGATVGQLIQAIITGP